jgi:amino acid adenylation domain-containing protein
MNDGFFPLSYPQRMFWLLDKLEPNSSANNLRRVFRMEGRLDIDALRDTFCVLLHRHDALRTFFVEAQGEPYQCVRDDVGIDLPVYDLSSLVPPEREIEFLAIAREEAQKPFNLERPPLVRLKLLVLSPQEHALILVMHHIITDGWSMSILFKEINHIYSQLVAGGQLQFVNLPCQYVDFAVWQQQALTDELLQEDNQYWAECLRAPPALLELPSDRPRPTIQSHHGAIERVTIEEVLAGKIKDICITNGVTLYMGLLACFQVLLWRYTGSRDISVATPVSGRNDADLVHIIGCFVNTLVLRGDFSANPSFRELLQRTRAAALEAFTHQELPFELLLRKSKSTRSGSVNPLFQIMFILQNAPKEVICLPGLKIGEIQLDDRSARLDLTLEIFEIDKELHCEFEYRCDMFDRDTIKRMGVHFKNLISSAVQNPDTPISKLNMLSAFERKQIVFDWNATSADYSKDVSIAQAFEDQVRRTPESIALREGVRTLTYSELDRRANQVAGALIEKGISPEMPVGIYMKRSIDAIVAILGVIKIGSPYVPLETSWPKHRLDLLIKACGCRTVLTDRAFKYDLPEVEAVLLDIDTGLRAVQSRVPTPSFSAGQPAYIIFTSGSTGVPKGVAGTHRATMNRLEWMYRAYPFSRQDVCCQKTALSFVDSIWEIFGPLLRGIPNVIIPEEVAIDPRLLLGITAKEQVTRIVLVPTLLRMLLDHAPGLGTLVPQLKLWTVSGEYLSVDLVERFRVAFPEAQLLNLYGSSEVAGDATCYEVGKLAGRSAIPIGKPISNIQVYILDEFLQPVPVGVIGTLYIGGDCLAQGYWHQPDLTSERFVPNPLDAKLNPVFATGDRVRWLSDGNIEYFGRQDSQTKIRGIRIELGEIEANLITHPLVRQAVVAVTGSTPETLQLTAYIESYDGAVPAPEQLQAFLRERLPLYMVPVSFVQLAKMPLLPSGKVDRRVLSELPTGYAPGGRSHIEPRNDIERKLTAIWQEVLNVRQFGVTDDFFLLGGNSLLAMQVLARIRKVFRVDVSIRCLFDRPSIDALAEAIDKAKASGAGPSGPTIVPRLHPATAADILSKLSPEQIEILLQELQRRGDAGLNTKVDPDPETAGAAT